jgi:hypothetical protein
MKTCSELHASLLWIAENTNFAKIPNLKVTISDLYAKINILEGSLNKYNNNRHNWHGHPLTNQ